jgi:hypothetical protein
VGKKQLPFLFIDGEGVIFSGRTGLARGDAWANRHFANDIVGKEKFPTREDGLGKIASEFPITIATRIQIAKEPIPTALHFIN